MSVNCRQTLSTKAFHPKKLKAGLAIMIRAGLDRDNFTDLHYLWDPIDSRPFYRHVRSRAGMVTNTRFSCARSRAGIYTG